jgi:hypothetical protein
MWREALDGLTAALGRYNQSSDRGQEFRRELGSQWPVFRLGQMNVN